MMPKVQPNRKKKGPNKIKLPTLEEDDEVFDTHTHNHFQFQQPIAGEEMDTETDDSEESETALRNPGIFDGLSAWFSSSVNRNIVKSWENGDGVLADVDSAMFIFSENAGYPDTVDIFHSDAYQNDILAVFHASYISKCVEIGNTKEVKLGDYFLPPKEVHAATVHKTNFPWTKNTSMAVATINSSTRSPDKRRNIAQHSTAQRLNNAQQSRVIQPLPSTSQQPNSSVQQRTAKQINQGNVTKQQVQNSAVTSAANDNNTSAVNSAVNARHTQDRLTALQNNPSQQRNVRSVQNHTQPTGFDMYDRSGTRAASSRAQNTVQPSAQVDRARNTSRVSQPASIVHNTPQKQSNTKVSSSHHSPQAPSGKNTKNHSLSLKRRHEDTERDTSNNPDSRVQNQEERAEGRVIYVVESSEETLQSKQKQDLTPNNADESQLSAYIPIEAFTLAKGPLNDFVVGKNLCSVRRK